MSRRLRSAFAAALAATTIGALAACSSGAAGNPVVGSSDTSVAASSAGAGSQVTSALSSSDASASASSSSPGPASSEVTESSPDEPTTTSSPATTQPSTSEPTTPAPTSQSAPSSSTSADTGVTGTVKPATLDARSKKWITTFCVGFADMAQYVSPDTTGMGKEDTINAVVQSYQHISDSAGQTAKKLERTAAPTFSGGKKLANGLQHWFSDLSQVYGTGSTTIKNGSYDTPSDLTSAISEVESHAADANTRLSKSVGQVTPQVAAAMLALPQCAEFASTVGG